MHAHLYGLWQVREIILTSASEEEVFKWHVPNFAKLVSWHMQENKIFRQALDIAVRRLPVGKNLRWIVYADEADPGNPLAATHGRKHWNFFAGVAEFESALCDTHCWIPFATLLSSRLEGVEGGLSQVYKRLMEKILNEGGMFKEGFFVNVDGVNRLVRCKMEAPLGDESALKQIWNCKGASGLKPCLKCTNVLSKMSEHADLPGMTDITCHDINVFMQMTDEDLFSAHDDIGRQKLVLAASRIDELEKCAGINYSPLGSFLVAQHASSFSMSYPV